MSLFKKVEHDANDVRILKCLRWRDRSEQEINKKFNELYPPCLIMVEKPTGVGKRKERSFVLYHRKFDVSADARSAVSKGFVGIRKRVSPYSPVDESFITKRGLDVLEPEDKNKK